MLKEKERKRLLRLLPKLERVVVRRNNENAQQFALVTERCMGGTYIQNLTMAGFFTSKAAQQAILHPTFIGLTAASYHVVIKPAWEIVVDGPRTISKVLSWGKYWGYEEGPPDMGPEIRRRVSNSKMEEWGMDQIVVLNAPGKRFVLNRQKPDRALDAVGFDRRIFGERCGFAFLITDGSP